MTNTSPLISIIIPTIGRPKYIRETVQSALAQSYRNTEILISDNAPKISTRSIIGEELARRVRIIERPVRLGFVEHFNECAESARGEFIFFLSDDDLLDKDYIETMVGLMLQDSGIKACFGFQKIIDYAFNATKCEIATPLHRYSFKLGLLDFVWSWSWGVGKPIHHGTFLSLFLRKSDWMRLGGFFAYPGGAGAENLMILKLAMEGDIAFASTNYYYRVYENSVGLSLPFNTLIDACRLFVADVNRLLANHSGRIDIATRTKISLLLRLSHARMMFGRLLRVYFIKEPGYKTLKNSFHVLLYAIGAK